jgi:type VI secretion system protein ImpG
MNAAFLKYYNDELDQLRGKAQRFAERHPKIAGRLRMSPNTVDDPHVERLLQGVAFATARVRQRIDDHFPELTDTLLETLYPNYLAPFPSVTIVQVAPDADQDDVRRMPRGTEIETEQVEGEICRFRTAHDVDVWPIEITAAELTGTPLVAPPRPDLPAQSVLRLSLKTTKPGLSISDLAPDRLRFSLRAPWSQSLALYQLLHRSTLAVAFADHAEDAKAIFAPPAALSLTGMEDDEALLPRSTRGFKGYQILTEFFGFPEKFLFFDISGLGSKTLAGASNATLDLFFYFDRWLPDLAPHVSAQSFALGCTPAVNLFSRRAEPIRLDGTRTEYAVVPDARRHRHQEVYAIDRVALTGRDGRTVEAPAFFGTPYGRDASHTGKAGQTSSSIFWQFRRTAHDDDRVRDHALLSIFDAGLKPTSVPDHVASVDVTCFNRDLPARLTFGSGRPHLQISSGPAAGMAVRCLTAPQRVLRPIVRDSGHWRVLSHLSLNHLSLAGGDGASAAETAQSLRTILRLYDVRQAPESRAMIDCIMAVSSEPATARLGSGTVARGLAVLIILDHRQIDEANAYFMARVLERFFGLYASINSFIRLTVRMDDQQEPLLNGEPIAGERWLA